MTVKVLRKNLIKQLDSIKENNVTIYGVTMDRQKLLAALRLQRQDDALVITPGKVSWHDQYGRPDKARQAHIDNESCIQFNVNHTAMRFLDRPKDLTPPAIINFDFDGESREAAKGVELVTANLIDALEYPTICTAPEESRPVLRCVLWECGNGRIHFTGADGFRLGMSSIKAKAGKAVFLIERDDISRLIKFCKGYDSIYMSHNKSTVTFTTGDKTIKVPKQDGKFPDYRQLIPKDGTEIQFLPSLLLADVKTLPKDIPSGIVRVNVTQGNPGNIRITCRSEEEHDTAIEQGCIASGNCKVAVNKSYLQDQLRVMGKGKAKMYIRHNSEPIRFEWAGGTSVVIPMFVQW